MSKRLILILALAFVVGITCAAYAEVQNVKVSGDITVKGVARNNFDLAKTQSSGTVQNAAIAGGGFEDRDTDVLSITRVRVDADLTDNVMATVRLLNERPWNGESDTATTANRNVGFNSALAAGTEEDEIVLDLAYVTLKEFLYSPLSLAVGRQELHFGNELLIGDPDTNIFARNTALAEGDLSARKSFDAVRATFDYNPLVVDAIYAKIAEDEVNLNDDVTLTGLNASYALNNNTTIEGFFFSKTKGSDAPSVFNLDANSAIGWQDTAVPPAGGAVATDTRTLKNKADIVNTLGVRVVDKTVKNLSIDAQGAWQSGTYNPRFDANARFDAIASRKAQTNKRNAWAAQLILAYDLKDIGMLSKWSPVVSSSYTYLSGANRDETRDDESYKGWDPMFENQTVGHIMNAIFSNTNMHRASIGAKAKLTDDITANLDYVGAWFAKRYPRNLNRQAILSGVFGGAAGAGGQGRVFRMQGDKFIGSEIDAMLTYDYTEDVQFSLLGGILLTGNSIWNNEQSNGKGAIADATEVIGSMKVTF